MTKETLYTAQKNYGTCILLNQRPMFATFVTEARADLPSLNERGAAVFQ